MNIISLGAGVQSSTMALMAAHREITPMPDAAIFADTQNEPKKVINWLDWLEKQLPFPVYRVTKGNLYLDSIKLSKFKESGETYVKGLIPFYTLSYDGKRGMSSRRCTADYKIAPLARMQRELMLKAGEKECTVWIGISTDEASRMKPSRVKYAKHIWPLIDLNMSRYHCLEWMKKHNYPTPPKSACIFCPFHNDEQWNDLKENSPDEFKDAVNAELKMNAMLLQQNATTPMRGAIYLHKSCKPLDTIDFRSAEDAGQISMFDNECEGMCGV